MGFQTFFAALTSIHCYDMTRDGNLDIICGRDDGILEIYCTEEYNEAPELRKSHVHNQWRIARVGGGGAFRLFLFK